MGNFAAFNAIPGVEVRTVFLEPVNSLVSGGITEEDWIKEVISANIAEKIPAITTMDKIFGI